MNSPVCITIGKERKGRPSKTNMMTQQHETNNTLLDIGKNMDMVKGREKIFYEDQKLQRECRLSEEINTEYERA